MKQKNERSLFLVLSIRFKPDMINRMGYELKRITRDLT